ncbi:MAG: hypothetical protein ACTSQK_10075, partial [Candidatus Heimdallarchaeota archaeon]
LINLPRMIAHKLSIQKIIMYLITIITFESICVSFIPKFYWVESWFVAFTTYDFICCRAPIKKTVMKKFVTFRTLKFSMPNTTVN